MLPTLWRVFEIMNKKMAIVYDFDKTLSTDDMQAFGFIQAMGFEVDEFWNECERFGVENKVDNILSYMYVTVKSMKDKNIKLTKEYLYECGKKVEFFKGVETWFERVNQFGRENDIEIEHYVVSSGLKEIIAGTKIAKYFKEVFACYFVYENDVPVWPGLAINYTNKTQYLYRINKGFLDVRDLRVNDEMSHEERAVPFSNIVYIGDSATDIPSMRLIYKFGGTAIGLYQEGTKNEAYLRDLLRRERISYVAKADYSENGELDILVKDLIKKLNLENQLAELRKEQKK